MSSCFWNTSIPLLSLAIPKIGISDRILHKPGPLDKDEREQIQRHCEIGYRIAQTSTELLPIADWILKHHEWWNGGGYPLEIKGEQIPVECRIVAIADSYDAMTNDRPYRKAISREAALEELARCAGTQFDPELIKIFTRVYKELYYSGQNNGSRKLRPKYDV